MGTARVRFSELLEERVEVNTSVERKNLREKFRRECIEQEPTKEGKNIVRDPLSMGMKKTGKKLKRKGKFLQSTILEALERSGKKKSRAIHYPGRNFCGRVEGKLETAPVHQGIFTVRKGRNRDCYNLQERELSNGEKKRMSNNAFFKGGVSKDLK